MPVSSCRRQHRPVRRILPLTYCPRSQYLSASEFQTSLNSIPGSPSVTQWLPVWAKDQPRNMEGRVESRGRAFSIESWEPAKRVLNISAGPAEEVRVRTYYYPYLVAKANNKLLPTRPD